MKEDGYIETEFDFEHGTNEVQMYKFDNNSVCINKQQRFNNVNKEDWDFSIGGYQPLQKWLKDRKGLSLSKEDVHWYERIIYSIRQSKAIMTEIDNYFVID